MATLKSLVHPLRSHAPGAATGQLTLAYLEAARKFFHESRAWRDEVPTITVGANTATYTLAPSQTDAEFFDSTRVYYKKVLLSKKSRTQIHAGYLTGTSPAAHRFGAANTLFISPDPDVDSSADLTVYAALRPTRTAAEIDDEAIDRFEEALLDGARWKLLLQPQPWRDVSMAEYYRKLFQEALDNAYALAASDGQVGVNRQMSYGGL